MLAPAGECWGKLNQIIPVQVQTIDDYCDKNSIGQIDILKIDTQGFDYEVLKGAERMLRDGRVRLIYTEIIFSEMCRGIPRFDKVYAYLSDNQYKLVSFYQQYYQNNRLSWTDALFMGPQSN